MHINKIIIKSFKRFSYITIQNIPSTTKLVVLAGPNGCGKSSLFDAFLAYHKSTLSRFIVDRSYHHKVGLPFQENWQDQVNISFCEQFVWREENLRKLFHFRTAYRNEADFMTSTFTKYDNNDLRRLNKLIENDKSVSRNYQGLIAETISALYDDAHDKLLVKELREKLIGEVRHSMIQLFESLTLEGIGKPFIDGTFLFTKGISQNFLYKNLSGGEKAAFDLILDFIIKRISFDNTVFCIDEPELHMNTRLQGRLLKELFTLLPDNSQLWIATHSIGMMRQARDMQAVNPDEVVFLDFEDKDFDQPQILEPISVNRAFWERTLKVALDDLADLVAPRKVVICEGNPRNTDTSKNAEFDARCYRIIFAEEFPDVQFLSAGNANDVEEDKLAFTEAIKALAKGIEIIRVIDRDARSSTEIEDLKAKGVQVLSSRHLESYLFDDEILSLLCTKCGKPEQIFNLLEEKSTAIENSIKRNNAPDDIKSAGGYIYNAAKKLLSLINAGNTVDAFCRDTLAPLVKQNTQTYEKLRKDIFNF